MVEVGGSDVSKMMRKVAPELRVELSPALPPTDMHFGFSLRLFREGGFRRCYFEVQTFDIDNDG
jgi:hypothetical protein